MEILIDIPETETERKLRKLKKEIKLMTAALDRVMAAIEANSDKVDQLIAKLGEPGEGTSDADLNAAAELLEDTNAKADAALETEVEVPVEEPEDEFPVVDEPAPADPVVTDPELIPTEPATDFDGETHVADEDAGKTEAEKYEEDAAAINAEAEAARIAAEVQNPAADDLAEAKAKGEVIEGKLG